MNNNYNFYFGRNSIYVALGLLEIKEGDEILTPAWDCDEALQPFRKRKCKLVFYRSLPTTFEVDIEHITSLITEKTKLIHIINHFGQIQNWGQIQSKIKKFNIPILEDNAYSFCPPNHSNGLGTFGDFSIFSYRKVMPVSNGSLLVNNYSNLKIAYTQPLLYNEEIKRIPFFIADLISFKLANILRSAWINFRRKNVDENYLFPLYSDETQSFPIVDRGGIERKFDNDPEKPSSKLSNIFIAYYTKLYIKKIGPIRKNNYLILSRELEKINGIQILHPSLKANTFPTLFSILIKNRRDDVLYKLRKQGFPVVVWPTLSNEVLNRLDEFPDVELLGRQLLQIELFSYKKLDYYKLVAALKMATQN